MRIRVVEISLVTALGLSSVATAMANPLTTNPYLYGRLSKELSSIAREALREHPTWRADRRDLTRKLRREAGKKLDAAARKKVSDIRYYKGAVQLNQAKLAFQRVVRDQKTVDNLEQKFFKTHPTLLAEFKASNAKMIQYMTSVNPKTPGILKKIRSVETPLKRENKISIW